MMKASSFVFAVGLCVVSSRAFAGFQSWTIDVEKDPFTEGERITALYSESIRTGAVVMCDTSTKGLMMRSVPGYAMDPFLDGYESVFKVAVDGKLVFEATGRSHAVGDSLAATSADISVEDSGKLVDAMIAARKQIAISDGISDRAILLKARGSTKAGEALKRCLEAQQNE